MPALSSPVAGVPESVPISTELEDEGQHQHHSISNNTHQFAPLNSLDREPIRDESVVEPNADNDTDQLLAQHSTVDSLHNDEQIHNYDSHDDNESASDILVAELEEASQVSAAATAPKTIKLEQQTRHHSHSRSSFGDTEMDNDFGEARLYTSSTTTWSPRVTSSPNYSSRAFARYGDGTTQDSMLHADVDESAMAELLGENEDLSSRRKFAMMTRLDDDDDVGGGDFDDNVPSYEPHIPVNTKVRLISVTDMLLLNINLNWFQL
jgi:hypothetical protein